MIFQCHHRLYRDLVSLMVSACGTVVFHSSSVQRIFLGASGGTKGRYLA